LVEADWLATALSLTFDATTSRASGATTVARCPSAANAAPPRVRATPAAVTDDRIPVTFMMFS
jgi:hypothetical protein